MRSIKRTLIVPVLVLLSILLSQGSAAAAVGIGLSVIGPITDAQVGMVISQNVTVTLDPTDQPATFTSQLTTLSSASAPVGPVVIAMPGVPVTVTLTLVLTTGDIAECSDTNTLTITNTVTVPDFNGRDDAVYTHVQTLPCSLPVTPFEVTPNPPSQLLACGPNNDVINLPPQPAGVDVLPDIGWSGGFFNVQFFPQPGYVFPIGTQTSYRFEDVNSPCSIVPPTVEEVCGPDNDIVTIPEQSIAVVVNADPTWDGGTFTVVFTPAEGYTLDPAVPLTYTFTDAAEPCGIVPVEPVQTALCGPNNDTIMIPEQPLHVVLASDTNWAAGARTITFTAESGFVLDPGAASEFTFTDEDIPCPTEPAGPTPIPTIDPTGEPTVSPTISPTVEPTATIQPTVQPSVQPTTSPGDAPAPAVTTPPPVTGLPKTGSGNAAGPVALMIVIPAIILMVVGAGIARERAA